MNPQQAAAFANPCCEAIECADPAYARGYRVGDQRVIIVLTLNVGLE